MTKLSLLGDFGFWSKMSKTPKESWITCYVCYVYGAVAECTMHSLKDHYDHWIIVIVLVFTAIMWFWIWRVYNLSSFTVYHHVSSCIMYRHWSSVISVFMVQHYSSSFPVTPLICHHGSSATNYWPSQSSMIIMGLLALNMYVNFPTPRCSVCPHINI